MKLPHLPLSLSLVFVCLIPAVGQTRSPISKPRIVGETAIVFNESLSVLRTRPSLYALPVQRMRRGRRIQILGMTEADGVKFYKVAAPPAKVGWVQADALIGKFRPDGEERFARLVQAAAGFDQIELTAAFLAMYPRSSYRPPMLLLYGDLLEDAAVKLSRDAGSRLSRREMTASGAPLHSYYLNFNMLDRYRRLGVTFLFNPNTRTFHYDGASWNEITRKFPASTERFEARKRLDSLKVKLERQGN